MARRRRHFLEHPAFEAVRQPSTDVPVGLRRRRGTVPRGGYGVAGSTGSTEEPMGEREKYRRARRDRLEQRRHKGEETKYLVKSRAAEGEKERAAAGGQAAQRRAHELRVMYAKRLKPGEKMPEEAIRKAAESL